MPSKIPEWGLAVVTCMDARVDPLRILGAEPGDVHVIRNAGGIVTDDVIRSLVASTQLLGVTRVQVIMHTDCGMEGMGQQVVGTDLADQPIDLRGFLTVEDELAHGVALLRSGDHLDVPGGVTGHIYDVETGRLRSVVS